MATLYEIVRSTVEGYAVQGANFESVLTTSPDGKLLTVVDLSVDNQGHRFIATSLIVRIFGKYVIIEHDDNDKPLVDALVQAGISRPQIILAYAGEPVPAAA